MKNIMPVKRIFCAVMLACGLAQYALAADTDGDGIVDVPLVSAGFASTCALDAIGVHCWGYNGTSQTAVPVLSHPVAVSIGDNHACAIDDNGVHCWGDNSNLQSTVPVLSNPKSVSLAGYSTCALDATGMHCWGSDVYGHTSAMPVLLNPTMIAVATKHACALDDTGVHCWGDNSVGQTTVPALSNPVAVSAGDLNTCAIDDTGVHCWGDNSEGQTTVPPLTNPVAVAVGLIHACAIDDTGVHCWGSNYFGEATVPVLLNPVAVSAGGQEHTCAVDDSGVHCWGYNSSGQTTVPTLSAGDNCLLVANANQLDTDADGMGDACDTDTDTDGDTVPDIADNCPLDANANQLNTDGDNFGNACDTDDDGDGVLDVSDAFPLDITESVDTDGDNLGDNSDPLPDDADTLNEIAGVAKGDKAGATVAFVGDFNGDGYGDYAVGTPGFDALVLGKLAKDVGLIKVYSGKNGAALAYYEGGRAKDNMGFAIAGNADLDKDGFMDVIAGAPFTDDLRDPSNKLIDAGSVTIFYGPDAARKTTRYGVQAKSLYGSALALADLNNDGFAEFIVGAPKADDTLNKLADVGTVTIYDHNNSELRTHLGTVKKGYLGSSIATGDYNGDGNNDVMIGAPGTSNNGAANAGYAVVYSSTSNTLLDEVYGAKKNDYLGKFVASGDMNNNGFADMLVGAPGYDEGKFKDIGSVTVISDTLPVPLFTGDGAVVKAADVNGDGDTDPVIGYPKDDFAPSKLKDNGRLTILLQDGLAYARTVKRGNASKDYYGTSFDLGDINGDGKADIILGIPGYDTPLPPTTKSVKDTGKVQIISGNSI